jgi:hypothetical protein
MYQYPSTFPHSPRQNRGMHQRVGLAFIFPVDISPCRVLSASVSQLFTPQQRL